MGIFFRLGSVILRSASFADGFGQSIPQQFHWKQNAVGQAFQVLRHRDQPQISNRLEVGGRFKIARGKSLRQLTHSVGAEVVTEEDIAALDSQAVIGADDGRGNEFVGDALVIGGLNRCQRVGRGLFALTESHRLVCLISAFPAPVAVHSIITPADRADASVLYGFDLVQQAAAKLDAFLRWCIAPVGNQMQNGIDAVCFGDVHQGVQMIGMAMHAASPQQADEMQIFIMMMKVSEAVLQDGILTESPVGDGIGNPRNILIDNPPGA